MDLFTEIYARHERIVLELDAARAEELTHGAEALGQLRRKSSRTWRRRAQLAVSQLIRRPSTKAGSLPAGHWSAVVVMVVGVSMLAACGDDDDDVADRPSIASPVPSATAPAGTSPATTALQRVTTEPASSTSQSTVGPAAASVTTATTTVDWKAEVAAMCNRTVAELTSIPDHDGTTAGLVAFVRAHRAARQRLGWIDETLLPTEVRDGPHGITTQQGLAEHALTDAEKAAAAGDAQGAQKVIGQYFYHLLKMANVFAVAGARCGGAEPVRAATADLNVPIEFEPLNVTAGFGSLWVTEHDGSRVARVDPTNGDLLAVVDAGVEPVKLQPADGRMWGRSTDAFFAIDPATDTITATLAKADVGPQADRAWAVDGGLWICDGQRIHRYDPTTLVPIAVIELSIPCDIPGGTAELIVASTFNGDAGESGSAAAAFIDPATNQLLGTVNLPVDVSIGIVLHDAVFFPADHGSRAVVVDRATWTVAAMPDLGAATGDIGTVESDGASVYVPTLDQRDVLVVDTQTFTVTDTIETLGVHSVAIHDGALWIAYYDGFLQRFDRAR